jgi:hypothetical protein
LILFTPSGVLTGKLREDPEKDALFAKYPISALVAQFTKNYREANRLPDDEPLTGNDGFITLTEAVLRADGATYTFKEVVVFFDQIAGVAIGNLS